MANSVRFFYEVDGFTVPHPIRVRRWLRAVALQESRGVNELRYIFCSDEYLHRMNIEYLNHDTLTDIITFDTSENPLILDGELYVSVERITENAQQLGLLFHDEFLRVLVHGLLHLCGYEDKLKEEIEIIRNLETVYISKF
ncbi:MAG: rRNA maturation RNase YbeY [Sphingobacteriaceae bacterium]|nr:rRNA maturation RNase YbeY [Cytophagaceae bacterium]